MGQKFIGTPGNWKPISEEEFKKTFGKLRDSQPDNTQITPDAVVRYNCNGAVKIGKVSGKNAANLIMVAPVVNQTRSGYQFSTMCDLVKKEDIIGRLQTSL